MADQSSPDHLQTQAGGHAYSGDRGLAPCLCGHSAADHARGGCLAVLGVHYGVIERSLWAHAEFCECSRFRGVALRPMPLESLEHAYLQILCAAVCASWTLERAKCAT